ncbi:DUF971 family protein [Allopseudospirillum japonicum]|uniref:DUF971 family protein n=1 Tax=Allopseudospirillum japonicum TaxID=64971 RepID=A0A1H6RJS9_9GAMM|nr:DUF971 domain-containing protein [Allopseudospirillum japonicum]SEI51845.1 DUF971 family protein [Allopseudospirillum japonicum]
MSTEAVIPTGIHYHRRTRELELTYADGQTYRLSAEFLRVHSPSAEVRGHGKPVLQYGKNEVEISALVPTGHYALKIVFDDGHDTGLYTWDYLLDLGQNQSALWQKYLQALEAAGASRQASLIKAVRLD